MGKRDQFCATMDAECIAFIKEVAAKNLWSDSQAANYIVKAYKNIIERKRKPKKNEQPKEGIPT